MTKRKHYLSNDLHNSLNILTVIEERTLYLLVSEIKKKYYEDKKICFDQQLDDYSKVYETELEGSVVRKTFRHTFKNMIDLLIAIPSKITILYEDGSGKVIFLFRSIAYNKDSDTFKIRLDEEFYNYIYIRETKKEFFIVYEHEFNQIKTSHAKALYRLCSRFINQRNYLMKIEVLKDYFKLGKKYRTSNITTQILKPAIDKIHKFTDFRVYYKKVKKEKELTHILFTFERIKDKPTISKKSKTCKKLL